MIQVSLLEKFLLETADVPVLETQQALLDSTAVVVGACLERPN